MSGEWVRSQLSKLITAYKNEPNLYDPRHKLYYHKQARNASLEKILKAVQQDRTETTLSDITKKIQTLRTQFGQEIGKVEKSKALGDDYIYKPKVWWFARLEWIGDYMKTRTDSTPLSKKLNKIEKDQQAILFEFEEIDEVEEADEAVAQNSREQFTTEIEISEFDSTVAEPPPPKIQKTFPGQKSRISKAEQDESRTIEYTLINEDLAVSQNSNIKELDIGTAFVEFQEQELPKSDDRHKRRARAFGKYVGALMTTITDDRTFFELQQTITSAIQSATINHQTGKTS